MYSRSGFIGASDADILVTLKPDHRPTADYVRRLRQRLPREFPGVTFYFVPADIVTQILNFGLPAPIDVQIEGSDLEGNRLVANQILADLRRVPGLTDLRIQQNFDYPKFHVTSTAPRRRRRGIHRARRRQQPAPDACRQRPDRADVLPQLAERRELQPGHPGAAVRDAVAPGPREHPAERRAGTARPPILGDMAVDRARQRDGGAVALQHPPRDRHLRVRAGPRPRRGGPRRHPRRRRAPGVAAARQLHRRSGASSTRCAPPTSASSAASSSRSCSSTC